MTIWECPACARCGQPAFDRCDDCDLWLCLQCGVLGPLLRFQCVAVSLLAPTPSRHVRV